MPWYLGNSYQYKSIWGTNFFWFPAFIIPVAVWSVVWTGLALWHAARRQEKWWFILFLLVHTAGVVEILYLIFVAKVFAKSTGAKKKKK
jgi:hypothetical protein